MDVEGGDASLTPPALHGGAATPLLVVLGSIIGGEPLAADCALDRIQCLVPKTKYCYLSF